MNHQYQEKTLAARQYPAAGLGTTAMGQTTDYGANCIKGKPLIESACDSLDQAIDKLSGAFNSLDSALSQVKRLEPAQCGNETACPPSATPLHGRIIDFDLRIRALDSRIRTTLDLLEI